MRIQLDQTTIVRFSMETFGQQLVDIPSCWKSQQAGPRRDSAVCWRSGESTRRERENRCRCRDIFQCSSSLFFFCSVINYSNEGFVQLPELSILFMYSLYSVAGYGFCMLVPMIEIDYSSSQCIPWSWDCCREDCRDLSLPKESFASKNCEWRKEF